MKILFLQLSDIHLFKKEDIYAINVEKVVQALNTLGPLDECIIVISGDISKTGQINEFKLAGNLIGDLVNRLKDKKFPGKWINVLVIPGNHDLNFNNNKRTFNNIVDSFGTGTIDDVINNDIKSLDNFYAFAAYNKCFTDNKLVSQKTIIKNGTKMNFTLVNTAILSLEGGSNQDKGIHYLSKEDILRIIPTSKNDLNVLIMHHSFEWFANNVKEKLRDILIDNYSLILEGHEHDGHGEKRKINNRRSINFIQGNCLSGDKSHEKGFNTVVYDSEKKTINGTSFTWNADYYKGTHILSETLLEDPKSLFINTDEFSKYLRLDDNGRTIDHYFVFPSLSHTITTAKDELETKIIDDELNFIKIILANTKTVISGENRSGKSTLSKIVYRFFVNSDEGVVPLLLVGEDLRNKRIDRIVEYSFKNQYEETNNSYDKFIQLDSNKRILIIDDAGKIVKSTLDKILSCYEEMFDKVVLFSEEKIDLNIKKRVFDQLIDKKCGQITIRPFLYDRRKILISKAYDNSHFPDDINNRNQIVNELNNMISSQVKFFRLNPDFIVNFVLEYSEKFRLNFSPEDNVFNMVYENTIKTRLINATQISNVNGVFFVLQEIAYYMHFERKPWISMKELIQIIDTYNKEFRQEVGIHNLLEVGYKAKILVEKEAQIRFKDRNLLAYFVAQALNRKFHFAYDDVKERVEYLLTNLCFGINSDIILFMALITSNPTPINIILECAHMHFENIEEFSLDKNNIPFLCQSEVKVKDSAPDESEKKEKEKRLVEYEEKMSAFDCVEIVDEYNYEQNVMTIENQLIKSIKYLEILSKILPAFSHNMTASQQDNLVMALYKYPNKFIYEVLHDISDNYDDIIEGIYENAQEIRKEKNIAEININNVKKMLEDMSVSLLVTLYQLVANTTSTKRTIAALEAFDYRNNSNYELMNLMMHERAGDFKGFYDKANNLYNESTLKLVESLVRFTVRNYFLDHDVKLVSQGQALLDKFFDTSSKQKVKSEMLKQKLKTLNN